MVIVSLVGICRIFSSKWRSDDPTTTCRPKPSLIRTMSYCTPRPPKLRRGFSSEKGAPQRACRWAPPRTSLPACVLLRSLLIRVATLSDLLRFHFDGPPRRPRLAPSGFTYRHMYKPFATLGNLGGLVLLRCIVQGPRPVSGGGKSAGGPARLSPILSREEKDALNHGRFLSNSPATHPHKSHLLESMNQ